MKYIVFIVVTFLTLSVGQTFSYYHNGKVREVFSIEQKDKKRFSPSYLFVKDTKGKLLGVTNQIILHPKNRKCGLLIRQKYKNQIQTFKNGNFLLKAKTPQESFILAKQIYEEGCVDYAHPDFLVSLNRRSFDPLFSQQWNLYNYGQYYAKQGVDLNITQAWQYVSGRGVKVAVIDDGFDLGHEDLTSAFVDQIDLMDQDDNASFNNQFESHGTACAGLIGARKNGIGVQGAAYNASLIGVKLVGTDDDGNPRWLTVSQIVNAFWYAKEKGADVINCSWGTYDVADAVRNIIADLAYNGRDGKGIPIVFASGNEGEGQEYWANDESALPEVIAVGAITNQGYVAWYSNYGPALDFVAPSGGDSLNIATTDIMGSYGYADGSYGHPNYCYAIDRTGFNGTSAAAPQVTAVIALMLEANPELTREEIFNILKVTARKIGEVEYINGHNDYYGFGLVDAGAAVQKALELKKEINLMIEGTFLLARNKWNLITTPVPANMPKAQLDAYTSMTVWAFDSAAYNYTAAGDEIEVGKGYWVKADKQGGTLTYSAVPTVESKDAQWTLIQNNLLPGTWNLVGTSFDTTKTEVRSALGVTSVWPFDATAYQYSTAENISAGQGFWVK